LGPGCGETCCYKCHKNISQDQRQEIFAQFYAIEETPRKWDFVARLVEAKDVQRRTTDRQELSRRNYTYRYNLIIGNNLKVPACKKFFLDTLAQSEQIIKTSLHKKRGRVAQFLHTKERNIKEL